jgi:hypothetical protein
LRADGPKLSALFDKSSNAFRENATTTIRFRPVSFVDTPLPFIRILAWKSLRLWSRKTVIGQW